MFMEYKANDFKSVFNELNGIFDITYCSDRRLARQFCRWHYPTSLAYFMLVDHLKPIKTEF